jgi:hypothetical protein
MNGWMMPKTPCMRATILILSVSCRFQSVASWHWVHRSPVLAEYIAIWSLTA